MSIARQLTSDYGSLPVPSRRVKAELTDLVGLFYNSPAELGQFDEVAGDDVPQPYQQLLVHNQHMTVTVEKFYCCSVNVQVLETKREGNFYARRILLARQSDGKIVQFGIVRLNFDFLDPVVRQEIESQQTPLGRVLIQHKVLREIELLRLWQVTPGTDLCRLFGTATPQTTYGRTAIIHCNGEPAVELLEVVAPVDV